MKYKVIYFEWVDATAEAGWMDLGADKSMVSIKTVGWLVEETKTYISVSTSVSNHGHMNGYLTVPKAWITKRRYVKL